MTATYVTEIYRIDFGGKVEYRSGGKEICRNSVEDLLREEHNLGIVIFDGISGLPNGLTAVLRALFKLRQSELFFAVPVFTSESIGWADAFFDGVCRSWDAMPTNMSRILERADLLAGVHADWSGDLRLLGFVSSRGTDFSLDVVASPALPGLRLYPVPMMFDANLLSQSEGFDYRGWQQASADALRTVKALCSQGFLQKIDLKDRYRNCARCGASNLNYIDLCPGCGSLNFEKTKMFHCFACGHIAKEIDFARDMNLVCPHCNSVLRRIGSDYDIPLESYSCNDCMQKFIEPEVKVRCMDCGAAYDPEDLVVQNVYIHTPLRRKALLL